MWRRLAPGTIAVLTVLFAAHGQASAQAIKPVSGFAYSSRGSIYVLPDGGKPRMIVQAKPGEYDNFHPVWSPDGTRIAFVRYSTKRAASSSPNPTALFVINADGSGLKRVTERRLWHATQQANWAITPRAGRPCWSPDGTMLAYPDIIIDDARHFSYQPIFVINLDGTGKRAATTPGPEVFDQDPSWSPDGKQIAFTRHTRASEPRGGYSIWAANVTGPGARELTGNWHVSPYSGFHLDAVMPRWSPDGSKIVFMSSKFKRFDIWIMDADGANPQRQTYTHSGVQSPCWSPGGKQIAFTPIWDRTRNISIFRKNISGPAIERVGGPEVETDDFDWSPVGTDSLISYEVPGQHDGIVFTSSGYQKKPSPDPLDLDQLNFGNLGYDIFVVKGDGTKPVNITKTHGVHNVQPSWSPDRKKVAFASNRGNSHEVVAHFSATSIYVINADGSDVTRLTQMTQSTGSDYCPSWSPDGKQIAFIRWEATKAYPYLCVMNADGTGVRILPVDPAPSYRHKISWSPTGERIAYTAVGRRAVGLADATLIAVEVANPLNRTQLNPVNETCTDPAWSANPAVLATIFSNLQVGSNVSLLTLGGALNPLMDKKDFHWPTWSPDGCKLVFHRAAESGLWIVHTDGAGLASLGELDPVARGKEPDWGRGWPMIGPASSAAVKERVLEMGQGTDASHVRFLSDGTTLLAALDKMIVWDLGTGKPKFEVEVKYFRNDPFSRVFDVAADEKSFYLLESEFADKKYATYLREHDIARGNPLRKLRLSEEKGSLVWVAVAGGGKTVLTGLVLDGPNIVTRLSDLSTGKTIKDIASFKPSDPLWQQPLYASPALPTLATTVNDGGKMEAVSVRLYDAQSGLFRKEIKFDQGTEKGGFFIPGGQISPDGSMLAVAPFVDIKNLVRGKEVRSGKLVRIFDTSTGTLKKSFSITKEKITVISLAFSPQGDKLALGCVENAVEAKIGDRLSSTGLVLVHDVATGKELKSWRIDGGGIFAVAFSPDGSMLAGSGVRFGSKRSEHVSVIHVLRLGDSPKQPVVAKLTPQELAKAEGDKLALGAKANLDAWNKQATQYQDQLRKDPDNAELHHRLGGTLMALGKPAEATAVLQSAVARDPKKADYHDALAQALAEQGKWPEALAAAQSAIRLDKDNKNLEATLAHIAGKVAQDHAATARKHAANLDWTKAAAALKDAIALQPNNSQLHAELGAALLKGGQSKEAAASLEQAVKLEPNRADWHADLGSARRHLKDWRGAADAYARAASLKPGNVEYQQAHLEAARQQGDWRQVENAYRTQLFTRPADTSVLAALGEAVLRQGRTEEAKVLIQQALDKKVAKTDLPELVRTYLTETEAGRPFELPGVQPVFGLSGEKARKKLEAAGYKVIVEVGSPAPSEELAQRIYAMEPGPGAVIDKGAVIRLMVYARPSELPAGMVKMPDLNRLSAARAKAVLDKEGLKASFKLGRAAPSKDLALLVYEVLPIAGTTIAKGTDVTVMLYGPPDTVADGLIAVPDLAGLFATKAEQALGEAGLKGRFQLGKRAPTKDKSLTVIQSDPAAGARVAKGAEIKITLYAPSDGKDGEPDPKDTVAVPDCATLSLEEATAKLKAAGFKVSSKAGRAANFVGQIGRVYQMEPAAGTRVRKGETVRLLYYANGKE